MLKCLELTCFLTHMQADMLSTEESAGFELPASLNQVMTERTKAFAAVVGHEERANRSCCT